MPIAIALGSMPITTQLSRTLWRGRKKWQLWYFVCLIASLAALVPGHAYARIYRVGPDEALKPPRWAERIVRSGDTVQIEPMPDGYCDCAIWRVDDLSIEGNGNDVDGRVGAIALRQIPTRCPGPQHEKDVAENGDRITALRDFSEMERWGCAFASISR